MKKGSTAGNKLFCWNPSGEALRASLLGAVIIVLSVTMKNLESGTSIFVRDILMILACGIFYPLHRMKKTEDYAGYGLHARRWPISLAINAVLAILLALVFVKEVPLPAGFNPLAHGYEVLYIMLAGIFETIVFYAYIRTAFERSFGIIAGILAAAAFYSFHHAGFQPEFGKLFFVGILYATTFRFAGGALAIFPFFWGIGATWDVLVQSEVVSSIESPEVRSLALLVGMLVAAAILYTTRTRARVPEGGAIESDARMSTDEYGAIMKERLGGEYVRFAQRANEALSLPAGARVLEIGPGPGWAGIELAKIRRDLVITAVEPSADMRETAAKNAGAEGVGKALSYVSGVAENLSQFPDGSFDAVISRDSLHHWDDPSHAFAEIERVLKKAGGVFIVDNKRSLSLFEWFLVYPLGHKIAGPMVSGWRESIASGYTPKELSDIFESCSLGGWKARSAILDVVVTRM